MASWRLLLLSGRNEVDIVRRASHRRNDRYKHEYARYPLLIEPPSLLLSPARNVKTDLQVRRTG